MSIKKLFEASNQKRNFIESKNKKDLLKDIESWRNLEEIDTKHNQFVPHVDYGDPQTFAKYGSAYLYYKAAFTRILDYYPYDGSDAEINRFYNNCLDIDKYILDNLYPRTTGYIVLSAHKYESTSLPNGYGRPDQDDMEYITFFGGPGTGSVTNVTAKSLSPDPYSEQFRNSNIYDESIYATEGMPSNYGSGSRVSNLRANFDDGVTVEFWLKTGSLDTTSDTKRQVVFDLWTSGSTITTGNEDYGRITIELDGTVAAGVSPFLITVQSASAGAYTGFAQQRLGTGSLSRGDLGDWKHYAISFQNSGTVGTTGDGDAPQWGFISKLYVNGHLNHELVSSSLNIGELKQKNSVGRIGALHTRPYDVSGMSFGFGDEHNYAGAGKLSGSLDEFRFWKVARNGEEIGRNWFDQIRGGVNTDIANTTLGVYYKFNEGIVNDQETDSLILDYAGRVTNGSWRGYNSRTANPSARNTGSAIVESSTAAKEYHDPIIRDNHPSVTTLRNDLLNSGSFHDLNNNGMFLTLLPGWILDDEEIGRDTDIQYISHIIGAYFDKLHLQISAIPKLRHLNYTSASYKPLPFAEHLPQSLGLYSPELFVDASLLERFMDRTEDSLFENTLNDTKNIIYTNLYNNLAHIYKAKGTEKAIRNVFRCFNIDDRLMRINIVANNTTIELQDNVRQTLINKKYLNFNTQSNRDAVVYQKLAGAAVSGQNRGYISGNNSVKPYGFTTEVNLMFPHYARNTDKMNRDFVTASLFGMHEVNMSYAPSYIGSRPAWLTNDAANFQVLAVKESKNSKNVYFMLTSSIRGRDAHHPFPTLTSSVFLQTYNNEQWNISVRVKPSTYPLAHPDFLTGAMSPTPAGVTSSYDVVFHGVNPILSQVNNSFTVSASLTKDQAEAFLTAGKRLYVGARRTDLTGAVINHTDVLVGSAKCWYRYLNDETLLQHALDVDNAGLSGSYRNVTALTHSSPDVLVRDSIILDWRFNNLTASNDDGEIDFIMDFSSGSTIDGLDPESSAQNWLQQLTYVQHPAIGKFFSPSEANVIERMPINTYRLINPEQAVSSDMIQIYTDDDRMYARGDDIPNYVYSIEKSLHNAISEEMLDFFAGVIDFNNLIGAPINKYRDRYKGLEKLREIFFRRVTSVQEVEKYMEYYKWFDDAIASIIAQLLPASSEFVNDVMNVVESHVLERNKYNSKFPTLNFIEDELNTFMVGAVEKLYPYADGCSPLPSSPRSTDTRETYWSKRAERNSPEITSGDAAVDSAREIIRVIINSNPTLSQSQPVISSSVDGLYGYDTYARRAWAKYHNFHVYDPFDNRSGSIKGGTNFEPSKDFEYVRSALYPAGPINSDGGVYVPKNVLLARTDEIVKTRDIRNEQQPENYIGKIKKTFKVQHGRDWEDGHGYKNTKSTFSFPFNVMSSSVQSGYNLQVVNNVTSGITITNVHNDVYGPDKEVPMQGPWTQHTVGGLQHRHIALNTSHNNQLDDWKSRPEAWKILLGTCVIRDDARVWIRDPDGGIGMVGPDYPYPEANEPGIDAYPVTASQKAIYYRDFIAKRPVNIRNIQMTTGAAGSRPGTVIGNYERNNDLIYTFGATENPRRFIDNQPSLPEKAFQSHATGTTNIRTIFDIHRGAEGHFEFMDDYSTDYLRQPAGKNDSVITCKFSAPGGIETMTYGYQNFRGAEYSAYNTINYRNQTVIKTSQGPSGTISEAVGTGPSGMRVYDIHGKDYGLRSHQSRHTAKFGRDSLFVTNPGVSADELPGWHKIHRNNRDTVGISNIDLKKITDGNNNVIGYAESITYITKSDYDNYFVQHPIPRSDRQYAWLSASVLSASSLRYAGYQDTMTVYRKPYATSSTHVGLIPYFDFVTYSGPGNFSSVNPLVAQANPTVTQVSPHLHQPLFPLNYWINEPLNASGNVLGYEDITEDFADSYLNDAYTLPIEWKSYFSSSAGHSRTSAAITNISGVAVPGGASVGNVFLIADQTKRYERLFDNQSTVGQNWSFSCWIKPVNDGSSYTLLDIGHQGSSGSPIHSIFMKMNHDNISLQSRAVNSTHTAAATNSWTAARNSLTHSVWNHVVVTFSASLDDYANTATASIYINGQFSHGTDNSTNFSATYKYTPSGTGSVSNWRNHSGYTVNGPITICGGAETGGREFSGSIDEAALYKTILTADDVLELYNGGVPCDLVASTAPKSASLMSWWRFGEGTAGPFVDNLNTGAASSANTSSNNIIWDVVGAAALLPTGKSGNDMEMFFETGSELPGCTSTVIASKTGHYLNMLLSKRQTKRWSWQGNLNRADHPVLIDERKNNTLSTFTSSNRTLTNYRLPPISVRGRPALINFTARTVNSLWSTGPNNITLKATDNNERIYFNELDLNNLHDVYLRNDLTPFRSVKNAVQNSPSHRMNWILYTQNLFPSLMNEFSDNITQRVGYDNKFWRDGRLERSTLGNALGELSQGPIYQGIVSQSSWCLDPPIDFLTRHHTGIPRVDLRNAAIGNYPSDSLRISNSAGELQNTFYSYVSGACETHGNGAPTGGCAGDGIPDAYWMRRSVWSQLVTSCLYARKHMLPNPGSVVTPAGVDIDGTGSFNQGSQNFPWYSGSAGITASYGVNIYAGEAHWDAPANAGILYKSGSGEHVPSLFKSYPSKPWFNDYDDFKYDLRLVAKGYSVVPEFRLSEHVRDYAKYGLMNPINTDTFEIPGTEITSTTGSFYKVYTNSEFMKDFLNVASTTRLNAKQIRLVCSAAVRFNPYKNFYPAQRSMNLLGQFNKSFGASVISKHRQAKWVSSSLNESGGRMRPFFQATFSPGILYNSIKSGLAVDYPIIDDPTKVKKTFYGMLSGGWTSDYYALGGKFSFDYSSSLQGYGGGQFWDRRLPFETMVEPQKYLKGALFYDMNPHPSESLEVTGAWVGGKADGFYTKMASNFFGQVGEFFLRDGTYTKLESDVVPADLRFASGSIFGARVKLRRSSEGVRDYIYESGSDGGNTGYSGLGARPFIATNPAASHASGSFLGQFTNDTVAGFEGEYFPVPQDPTKKLKNLVKDGFRYDFEMYSRPSAFGPPVSGRPTGSYFADSSKSGTMDSFNGFNWSFTPPYYNGEAWVDLIFRPDPAKSYDLEQILAEVTPVYRRVDPGPPSGTSDSNYLHTLVIGGSVAGHGTTANISPWHRHGNIADSPIYSGENVNSNAMQISASINLFGVERVFETTKDNFGNIVSNTNKTVGSKWVIQPKFETPMLNFADFDKVYSVCESANTLTLPVYGSASVPRGMWHQFGVIPDSPNVGIFLEIEDIPENWLKYHYEVVNTSSVYNNFNIQDRFEMYKKMDSLLDLAGFQKTTTSVRLGELAESQSIKEAVVAIPFIIENIAPGTSEAEVEPGSPLLKQRKKFISIPKERMRAAEEGKIGTAEGDSLRTAGRSIRKLKEKMQKYILPPQFDFINNPDVDPMVMYMFEFEYKLDKDDLSYIWQNLAPRDFRKIEFQVSSVAHEIMDTELLSERNLFENEHLRWMVFKVKQKADSEYYDLLVDQAGKASRKIFGPDKKPKKYPSQFNWPYDYLSIVELIKLDVDVLFK